MKVALVPAALATIWACSSLLPTVAALSTNKPTEESSSAVNGTLSVTSKNAYAYKGVITSEEVHGEFNSDQLMKMFNPFINQTPKLQIDIRSYLREPNDHSRRLPYLEDRLFQRGTNWSAAPMKMPPIIKRPNLPTISTNFPASSNAPIDMVHFPANLSQVLANEHFDLENVNLSSDVNHVKQMPLNENPFTNKIKPDDNTGFPPGCLPSSWNTNDNGKGRTVCVGVSVKQSNIDVLNDLSHCDIIDGNLEISHILQKNTATMSAYSLPRLREVTGYVLVYNVIQLPSLGTLLPALAVIRGNSLFGDYALLVSHTQLKVLGLQSLQAVLHGAVYVYGNYELRYHNTVDFRYLRTRTDHDSSDKARDAIQADAGYSLADLPHAALSQCPHCNPASNTRQHCWSSHQCQIVCPDCIGGCMHTEQPLLAKSPPGTSRKASQSQRASTNLPGSSTAATCCNTGCIGGCYNKPGVDVPLCNACRKFLLGEVCVMKCPPDFFEYNDYFCISKHECLQHSDHMVLTRAKADGGNLCVRECPTGFRKDSSGAACEPCSQQAPCHKDCPGTTVTTLSALHQLSGCTHIHGSLVIRLPGRHQLDDELRKILGEIVKISDFLSIQHSDSITSLNFLMKLRSITGHNLFQQRYALHVYNNAFLTSLWPAGHKLIIEKGSVMFLSNSRLCPETISNFTSNNAITMLELPQHLLASVNGNFNKCRDKIDFHAEPQKDGSVKLSWFLKRNSYLPDYVLYFKQVTDKNESHSDIAQMYYTVWSPHFISRRRDVDVSTNGTSTYTLRGDKGLLRPYTWYVFYLETIGLEGGEIMSETLLVRTAVAAPSSPEQLRLGDRTSVSLEAWWELPAAPNGPVDYYSVTYAEEFPGAPWDVAGDHCTAASDLLDDVRGDPLLRPLLEELPRSKSTKMTTSSSSAPVQCQQDIPRSLQPLENISMKLHEYLDSNSSRQRMEQNFTCSFKGKYRKGNVGNSSQLHQKHLTLPERSKGDISDERSQLPSVSISIYAKTPQYSGADDLQDLSTHHESTGTPLASNASSHSGLNESAGTPLASNESSHSGLSESAGTPLASDVSSHSGLSESAGTPLASDVPSHSGLSESAGTPLASDVSSHSGLSESAGTPLVSDVSSHSGLSESAGTPLASDASSHSGLSDSDNLYKSGTPTTVLTRGPVTRLRMEGLRYGTVYRVQVRACNYETEECSGMKPWLGDKSPATSCEVLCSARMATRFFSTAIDPGADTVVNVSLRYSDSVLRVGWSPPAAPNGLVVAYYVSILWKNLTMFKQCIPSSSSSFTFNESLFPGWYGVRVTTRTTAGGSGTPYTGGFLVQTAGPDAIVPDKWVWLVGVVAGLLLLLLVASALLERLGVIKVRLRLPWLRKFWRGSSESSTPPSGSKNLAVALQEKIEIVRTEKPLAKDWLADIDPTYIHPLHCLTRESKTIGRGNFGDVWRGKLEVRCGAVVDVAVKQLRDSHENGGEAGMVEEAKLMINLRCAHVIRSYGVVPLGTSKDGLLLVLELMNRGNLHAFLLSQKASKGSTLSKPQVAQKVGMALQVADGMLYLTSKQILHRDLAARNCLLDSQLNVKVSDFGLSRYIDISSKDYYRIVGNGIRQIPFRTVPPEFFTDKKYNFQSEVWSYGVLLWEILSGGATPYENLKTDSEVELRVSCGHTLATSLPDCCPGDLTALLQRCWKFNGDERPTFSDIIGCLQLHLQNTEPLFLKQFRRRSFYHSNMMKHRTENRCSPGIIPPAPQIPLPPLPSYDRHMPIRPSQLAIIPFESQSMDITTSNCSSQEQSATSRDGSLFPRLSERGDQTSTDNSRVSVYFTSPTSTEATILSPQVQPICDEREHAPNGSPLIERLRNGLRSIQYPVSLMKSTYEKMSLVRSHDGEFKLYGRRDALFKNSDVCALRKAEQEKSSIRHVKQPSNFSRQDEYQDMKNPLSQCSVLGIEPPLCEPFLSRNRSPLGSRTSDHGLVPAYTRTNPLTPESPAAGVHEIGSPVTNLMSPESPADRMSVIDSHVSSLSAAESTADNILVINSNELLPKSQLHISTNPGSPLPVISSSGSSVDPFEHELQESMSFKYLSPKLNSTAAASTNLESSTNRLPIAISSPPESPVPSQHIPRSPISAISPPASPVTDLSLTRSFTPGLTLPLSTSLDKRVPDVFEAPVTDSNSFQSSIPVTLFKNTTAVTIPWRRVFHPSNSCSSRRCSLTIVESPSIENVHELLSKSADDTLDVNEFQTGCGLEQSTILQNQILAEPSLFGLGIDTPPCSRNNSLGSQNTANTCDGQPVVLNMS